MTRGRMESLLRIGELSDVEAHAGTDTEVRQGLLCVHDLHVNYGGMQAVNGVSFEMAAPSMMGLIGPNGAGKSSLLGAIAGQVRADIGGVYLVGKDVSRLPPNQRAREGIVRTFQTASVFDGLTVFENLMVAGAGVKGASLRQALWPSARSREWNDNVMRRAHEMLDELEIAPIANSYGRELSGGQRRLTEIARCLMCRPKLLLLDEPMVGVAPHLVTRIGEMLRRVTASGVGVIIVEHALEVVETFCERVIVMADGQMIASDTFEKVVEMQSVREAYLT